MRKMRTALTKLRSSLQNKKKVSEDEEHNKLARSLQGRTNLAKSVSMSDPLLIQGIKEVLQQKEIRMLKDPLAEMVNGSSDAARPFCIRRGRNILKFLVKSDEARGVLEKTVNAFRDTLLAGPSNKNVNHYSGAFCYK